jgi:hypothetical protein
MNKWIYVIVSWMGGDGYVRGIMDKCIDGY